VNDRAAPAAPGRAHIASATAAGSWRLTNGRYAVQVSATGSGGSWIDDLAITRWNDEPFLEPEGWFVYLRDRASGALWSAGLSPTRVVPTAYRCEAVGGRITIAREDDGIAARMEIAPDPERPLEWRRVTLTNRSTRPRALEVTSYLEPVLARAADDAAHPAFSKLFLETDDHTSGTLLARRRPRRAGDRHPWVAHAFFGAGSLEHETDRARFIGREGTLARPRALIAEKPLSGTTGSVLDPALILRRVVSLPPGESRDLVLVLAAGDSREAVLALTHAAGIERTPPPGNGRLRNADHEPALVLRTPKRHAVPLVQRTQDPAGTPDALQWFNGIGGFNQAGDEYVIRLERDARGALVLPPKPWINVIANERFGFLVSERGAGCTWSGNSREHRLTPWSNDPVCDPYAEALYLRDEESGTCWSPLPGPLDAGGRHEVRHGFGYTCFRHEADGIGHDTTMFAARRDPVKLTTCKLSNRGGRARRLSLFAIHRLVLGATGADRRAIATEILAGHGAILARRGGEPAATFAALAGPQGAAMQFSGDEAAFIGAGGSLGEPAALATPTLDGRAGADLTPCLALQITFEVPANGETELVLLLGEGTDAADARALIERYAAPAAARRALEEVRAFWSDTLSRVRIETPSPPLDLMVNGWLLYQTIVCRLWARSGFFQSGGAYGFRDQLQDASALALVRSDLTREQILLNARHQFVEGDVLHWWHPEGPRGLRTRFADDLLWLPYLTADYIQTTGDEAILDQELPFMTAPALAPGEDEVFLTPQVSRETADLYEHCCRALDRSLGGGVHDLPLFGTGDWNDGMNAIGREGRGESVWMAFFLYAVLGDFIPMCERRKDADRVKRYRARRASLPAAIEKWGWDDAWYLRAWHDDGAKIGSRKSDECRIDALVQAWATLSGAAPPERADQALDALESHLIDDHAGIIRLLTPPFDKTPHDPGYIRGYLPGVRENGGQYTHAAVWVARAFAERGRRDRAAHLLEMLSPVSHGSTPEAVATYQVEPYVVAADVYGVSPHVGHGGWTWYTGSSGWMFRTAVESILGLQLEGGDTIVLKPCIPDEWPRAAVTWKLPDGGGEYRIAFANPSGTAAAIVAATLDGQPIVITAGSARVPIIRDAGIHVVNLTLGGVDGAEPPSSQSLQR